MKSEFSSSNADPVSVIKPANYSLSRKRGALSLRRNFSWNLIGNIVYAGCQWGILVLLAKLTSPEMVGRFALGTAVTAPIIMFSQLQLRSVQATDAKDQYPFGLYLGLRLLSTLAALLIIAVLATASGYPPTTAFVIMAVGLSKAFESISDVYYGLMQRYERMDLIARSRLLKGPISLIALGAIIYLTRDVFWGVMALAGVWASLLVVYDLRNSRLLLLETIQGQSLCTSSVNAMKPMFQFAPLLKLAWLALPLGIVMTMNSLTTNIPRYFIQNSWGEYELGVFSAIAYTMVAGNTVVAAMGQSVSPRLAQYYADSQYDLFRRLLLRLLGMGLFMGCAGILVALFTGEHLLSLLYGPQYAAQNDVFVWLMIAGAASYVATFLGYAETAARYFRIQLPVRIIVMSATALGCFMLVPSWGTKGAAAAMAFGLSLKIIFSIMVVCFALRTGLKR